jgi:hypothetical protein
MNIANVALSQSGRPVSADEPPISSAIRTSAVPSIVNGLNFAGVPMAACSDCAMR